MSEKIMICSTETEKGATKSPTEADMTPKSLDASEDSAASVNPVGFIKSDPVPMISLPTVGGIGAALILVSVLATLFIQKLIGKGKKRKETEIPSKNHGEAASFGNQQKMTLEPNAENAGKIHNIGKRNDQQDSFGVVNVPNGVCAVVADGMGGLSDGDKVSQKIVRTILQDALKIKTGAAEGRKLYQMAAHANQEVNKMLGTSGQYKSGSTLVAVLAERDRFQWIAAGDSRIYLFRGNRLLKLNSEHIYEKELLLNAVNNQISFSQAAADKQCGRLTNFIGMGELKYIDGSLHPVETQAGDKIILMSDGVFHTLSEQEICKVLSEAENAVQAAQVMEQWVLGRKNPKQDNFTVVILDF